ncbi:tail fiber domain-containing protein [Nostoc sp.]|uniref:tail fiber domain-containing protein n=1 Tax=Nostoc sp. TaxID=1180 RepID=UPI002FF9DA8B
MSDFQTLIVTDRVGIGTERPEPETQLHISPTDKDGKIYLESGGNLLQVIVNSTIATIGTSGSFPLQLRANLNQSNFSGIYISNNGNVGIGTTSPSFNLDIQGIINATQYNKNGNPWKITNDDIDDNAAIDGNKMKDGSIPIKKIKDLPPSTTSQWVSGSSGIISYSGGNVGIGTTTPTQKFEVNGTVKATQFQGDGSALTGIKFPPSDSLWELTESGGIYNLSGNFVGIRGAIMPSVGNLETAGIMFPKDAFGGSGDAAWIRYYARTGEATTLEIGTSNDPNDHIALMPSLGNVGIGTIEPQGKLDVRGDIRAGNSDIYFTKTDHNHTGGIGNTKGFAAIENASNFDALMILGRAGTPKGRTVKLWDYLQVNGGMDVTGNVGIGTQSPEALLHVFSPDPTFGGNVKLFPTDGKRFDFSYDGGNDGTFAFNNYGKDTGSTLFQWQKPDNSFVGLLQIKNNGQVIGNFGQSSSRELKENITDFSTQEAIEALANLNPVKFNYREDNQKQLKAGFIAEDVPELVATADRKAICALDIVAVLTKVIQQQQQELSSLKERLNALEAAAS